MKVEWNDGRWAHYGSDEQARDYANAIRNGYVEADAVTLGHISSIMIASRDFADLASALPSGRCWKSTACGTW